MKRFRRAAHLLISGDVYPIDYPADGHDTSNLTSNFLSRRKISAGTLCLAFFATTNASTADSASTDGVQEKIIVKPGIPVTVTTQTEDLTPTDDPELAKRQVEAYPESPEASFIYAVALTRTSRVEEALKEVRRARRLAEKEGGPAYFDKMIASYEEMLKNYPDENRVRYGLAWAYYMKAYLVARQSKREQEYLEKLKQAVAAKDSASAQSADSKKKDAAEGGEKKAPAWLNAWAAPYMPKDKDGNSIKLPELKTGPDAPHIKGAMEHAAPSVVPQVKSYYQSAINNLDELIKRKPDDVWAIAYRAHLNLEYSGDLDSSMAVWKECAARFPNNPAAFFFLGEGYLKQGNLKECLSNISRAVALRGISK
ncbi:MAG: tetratricopeptide repeat protein [Candidatus Melainabacteria bacterium]|nr:tetratricopeptide repeat protein [Candidatus Melainabacteria bacterium]